jgi:hypothetical protein
LRAAAIAVDTACLSYGSVACLSYGDVSYLSYGDAAYLFYYDAAVAAACLSYTSAVMVDNMARSSRRGWGPASARSLGGGALSASRGSPLDAH